MTLVSGAGRIGGVGGQRVTATAEITLPGPVTPPTGWQSKFAGDQPPGSKIIGNSLDTSMTQAEFDTMMGTPSAATREYFQPNQITEAVAYCQNAKNEGRLPIISFKLPGSWRAVANRQHDAWVTEVRDRLFALDMIVWISFHHEPNGNGPALDFTDMYDLCLYPLFKVAKSRLTVAPILNGYAFLAGGGGDPYQWCPKSPDCELVLYDHYNQWWTYDATLVKNFTGGAETINGWRPVKTTLDMARTIIGWGKATGIVEWGVHLAYQEPGKSGQYITDFMTGLYEPSLDRCIAAAAFQSRNNSPRGGWRFDLAFKAVNSGNGSPKPIEYYTDLERVNAAKPLWASTVRINHARQP